MKIELKNLISQLENSKEILKVGFIKQKIDYWVLKIKIEDLDQISKINR